ncbi:hypothetical protein FSP39_022543, partial [Pinctada imbricata]
CNEYSIKDKRIQDLVKAAIEVKANAYCPYSNFRVGASLLTENDVIITGCNVENASYGLSVCAERVAIMSAVSQGHTKFKAAAVSCDIKGDFKAPCGACRQFYAEFNLDLDLYLVKPDNTVKCVKIRDVLPMAFTPQSLEEDRI